jgi:hypothetical protein
VHGEADRTGDSALLAIRSMGRRGPGLLLAVILAFGCGNGPEPKEATQQNPEVEADAPTSEAGSPLATAPDTTAADLVAYVDGADYRRTWAHMPGTGDLYPGREPHGALLTTYVNEIAYPALGEGKAPLPRGAVIVKENYAPDSALVATTMMYKASQEYDPRHGNWFWLKLMPDGTVEAAGRVSSCISCHEAMGQADYIVTRDTASSEPSTD